MHGLGQFVGRLWVCDYQGIESTFDHFRSDVWFWNFVVVSVQHTLLEIAFCYLGCHEHPNIFQKAPVEVTNTLLSRHCRSINGILH